MEHIRRGIYERIVLSALQNLTIGTLHFNIQCSNRQESLSFGKKAVTGKQKTKSAQRNSFLYGPIANITVTDLRFFKSIVFFGDVGFGEAYVNGYWKTSDIAAIIYWFLANLENVPTISGTKNKSLMFNILKWSNILAHFRRKNFPSMAKSNIHKHYDLSNDFFKLFLDETMTYSSAYFYPLTVSSLQNKNLISTTKIYTFPKTSKKEQHSIKVSKKSATTTNEISALTLAQLAKYERLCRLINLKKGDKVLEIGCGWGGFAMYAQQNYGANVHAITLSKKQYSYAEAMRKQKKITRNKLRFEIIDYRHMRGAFDKIVSIEMIEAVGWQFLNDYFSTFQRLLRPSGIFALQAIVCPDRRFSTMKRNVDWLQKHIFPGSCLPSLKAIIDSIYHNGDFFLYDAKDLGQDYAHTLSLWYDRFNAKLQEVKDLGYSEDFIRKWNYYLKYCEAAFKSKNISVMQLIFRRPNRTV